MANGGTSEAGAPPRHWIWVSSLLLITLVGFWRVLTFGFAAPDAYTLILTSRVDGLATLFDLFTGPLMQGTAFAGVALFYRPVTQLTFAIDHALWGLDPFGYHLTNLVLHSGTVVLAYSLARRLSGSRWPAWLGAALFAVHPILMDSIPSPQNRQDILAAFFLLASLALLGRHLKGWSRRPWMLAGSVLALVAAFGSKEIAMIGVPLLPLYAWYAGRAENPSLVAQCRKALARTWPHITAGLVFLAWRTYVLGGVGGYRSTWIYRWTDGPVEAAAATGTKVISYLVYPLTMISGALDLPLRFVLAGIAVGLLLILALLYHLVRSVGRPSKVARRCTGWLLHDSRGTGVTFLLLFLATTVALLTSTFAHAPHNMYLPSLPFSLLVGWGLVASIRTWRGASRDDPMEDGGPPSRVQVRVSKLGAIGLGLLAMSLMISSPLTQTGMGEWDAKATYNERFLAEFDESLAEVEPGAKVWITGYAGGFIEPRGPWAHAQNVGNLVEHSIESWLSLHDRRDAVGQIIIEHPVTLDRVPDVVTITVETPGNGTTVMRVENSMS